MTKDHACFDLLLRTEYYQANIDMELTLDGIPHEEGWKTTALHSSITQKNYYCAYYLLHNPLPPIEFFSHSESNEEGEGEKSESVEKHIQVANINQISCSGSTPLRIAVFIHDLKMVCLLYKISQPDAYLPKSSEEEAKSDKTTALGNAIDSLNKSNLTPQAKSDFEQIKKILEGDDSIVESTANKVLESCGIAEKDSSQDREDQQSDNEDAGEDAQSPSQEENRDSLNLYINELSQIEAAGKANALTVNQLRARLSDIISRIDANTTEESSHKPTQPDETTASEVQNLYTCDVCGYKCSTEAQLRKHKEKEEQH